MPRAGLGRPHRRFPGEENFSSDSIDLPKFKTQSGVSRQPLSGGKGNIRNVLVGTLFIGILQNGMTILDFQYTTQNVLKSTLLLAAIIADSLINPRDEQTDQQGDI